VKSTHANNQSTQEIFYKCKILLKKWLEEEKSFEGDTLVWVFLFS
jgi:hypothetical protein